MYFVVSVLFCGTGGTDMGFSSLQGVIPHLFIYLGWLKDDIKNSHYEGHSKISRNCGIAL